MVGASSGPRTTTLADRPSLMLSRGMAGSCTGSSLPAAARPPTPTAAAPRRSFVPVGLAAASATGLITGSDRTFSFSALPVGVSSAAAAPATSLSLSSLGAGVSGVSSGSRCTPPWRRPAWRRTTSRRRSRPGRPRPRPGPPHARRRRPAGTAGGGRRAGGALAWPGRCRGGRRWAVTARPRGRRRVRGRRGRASVRFEVVRLEVVERRVEAEPPILVAPLVEGQARLERAAQQGGPDAGVGNGLGPPPAAARCRRRLASSSGRGRARRPAPRGRGVPPRPGCRGRPPAPPPRATPGRPPPAARSWADHPR